MVRRYMIAGFVLVCFMCAYISRTLPSLENTDYAVSIRIAADNNAEKMSNVRLYVANLLDYRGSSEQILETEVYDYRISSVEEMMPLYKEESKRELSLSHIKQIILDGASMPNKKETEELLLELSEYVNLSDNVRVKLEGDLYPDIQRDENNTIGFRELIKTIYKGESLYQNEKGAYIYG